MFLCRETELCKLSSRYNGNGLECIIIYGRRRVGKTALINEFCKNKKKIYFPALDSNAHDNLETLSKSIQAYLQPDMVEFPVYTSFDAAFSEITRLARTEKRLIFVIDELPYLVKADRSIPSRLQHLMDHDLADTDMFIILCGSSMSFMEEEVLGSKSPLFGRRTAQLKIEPLTYLDTARFHPDLKAEDKALIYAVTGGIPHYINKLNVRGDIRESLISNFFDTSAYLFDEPEKLLKQELREPAMYNSIITAIANGRTRLSDIAAAVRLSTSACMKYITTLIQLGIVRKDEPVADNARKKTQYRIADQLFRFWYRFIPGNMMSISSGTFERVFDTAVGSYLNQYMGLTFEEMCRDYLVRYAEDLPFPIATIGSWWGAHPVRHTEVELDIVATAPKADNTKGGRQFIIGSCKYTNDPVDTGELALIRDYSSIFTKNDDKCYYYIFSKGGFTSGLKELSRKGEVKLITLEDIYKQPVT